MYRANLKKLLSTLPWVLSAFLYRLKNLSWIGSLRFTASHVGKNTYVDPSVQIIGWKNVSVGSGTIISEGAWLNVNYRESPEVKIRIGNNCHIGRQNFFSSGPLIHIKDYGFTGLNCHFLGCGHMIDSPLIPYVNSGLNSGGIIEIGVNCWLSTSVTVMENVRIGCGSVIGARSLVLTDLPKFCIAVGSPAKVIKRFDFRSKKWLNVDDWSPDSEKYYPSEEEYLSELKRAYARTTPSLIAGSRRFGWL